MNGELSALHTSNRTIPIDVMKLINEQINIYSKILQITPCLLPTMSATLNDLQSRAKISVGSLGTASILIQAVLDFREMSCSVYEKKITGSEKFPGECQAPSRISHLDDKTVRLLARFYMKVYGFTFYAACDPKPDQNAIYVSDMVERFATIRLGDEIFGSRY